MSSVVNEVEGEEVVLEPFNWEFSFPILDRTVEGAKEWMLDTIRKSGFKEEVSITFSFEEWVIKVVIHDLETEGYRETFYAFKLTFYMLREICLKAKHI